MVPMQTKERRPWPASSDQREASNEQIGGFADDDGEGRYRWAGGIRLRSMVRRDTGQQPGQGRSQVWSLKIRELQLRGNKRMVVMPILGRQIDAGLACGLFKRFGSTRLADFFIGDMPCRLKADGVSQRCACSQ